jgi:hypothetical protein
LLSKIATISRFKTFEHLPKELGDSKPQNIKQLQKCLSRNLDSCL